MGMDASETFKTAYSEPKTAQIRNPNMSVVTNNHICHLSFSTYEQRHLSFDFMGNRGNLAGQFMRNDLMGGYSAAVEILKPLLLGGFQTAGFAIYFFDSKTLRLLSCLHKTIFFCVISKTRNILQKGQL